MKGTILQPTYLPWSGYFEMISACDAFVAFDHVQFERKSWQNRNRIKTANGIATLTVPVEKAPQTAKISEIKISYSQGNPLENHWKTISSAYKKSPYFEKYKPLFEKIYSKKYVLLRDLNMDLIKLICDILGIEKETILSSELNLKDEKIQRTEKVVNLCKKTGIDCLYDAKGAEELLEESLFEKENIKLEFQNFHHPEYSQLWGDFIPYLSTIDLIFNEGEKSLSIIKSGIVKG
ncbi:MAG: WbqC family protein [Candidatus Staskawiczbacteria bacterium]|nr:WbqC family protein [Candidatus Staskawiczbacteria bacterium]